MNDIILKGLKKHTKDFNFKPLGITLLSVLFIGTITFLKYKPVYSVTVSGNTLGYISEKSELDKKITEYINHREGTIALIEIANMPEYSFELISRESKTQENKIFEEIKDTAVITYKTYAITVNGEQKNEVNTKLEAESIITELQSDLKEGVQFDLGIVEVYRNEKVENSKDSTLDALNSLKLAKTEEYEAEQARIEAERLEAERIAAEEAAAAEAARKAAVYAQSKASAESASYGSGNISGISLSNPLRVSPLITSRFGESGSRRWVHTGVDLATSMGTPIYPIASGTVTFAGWQGSYGNLIMIDHGDGIQSWYGHCNEIYVSEGEEVGVDTCIGAVGSTGNSTGPHLHLEIRVNGEAVNPQNYLY